MPRAEWLNRTKAGSAAVSRLDLGRRVIKAACDQRHERSTRHDADRVHQVDGTHRVSGLISASDVALDRTDLAYDIDINDRV